MNDFDRLRAVLQSKALIAANDAGIADAISIGNENFTPPKRAIYAEFWYKTGGSKNIDLGGGGKGFKMTVGIYQFDIFVPEHTGDGPGLRVGDLILKRFENKSWPVDPDGYVNMLQCDVKTPFKKAQNGFYRIIVDGQFHFYRHDPNPQAFDQ